MDGEFYHFLRRRINRASDQELKHAYENKMIEIDDVSENWITENYAMVELVILREIALRWMTNLDDGQ